MTHFKTLKSSTKLLDPPGEPSIQAENSGDFLANSHSCWKAQQFPSTPDLFWHRNEPAPQLNFTKLRHQIVPVLQLLEHVAT